MTTGSLVFTWAGEAFLALAGFAALLLLVRRGDSGLRRDEAARPLWLVVMAALLACVALRGLARLPHAASAAATEVSALADQGAAPAAPSEDVDTPPGSRPPHASLITAAEARVMKVLWRQGPRDAREITKALEPETGWARTTVNTLISRLEAKKVVTAVRGSSPKRYVPLVDSDDYGRAEMHRIADLLYEGRIAPLVASFGAEGRLPPEEVEDLRKVVEKMAHDEQ